MKFEIILLLAALLIAPFNLGLAAAPETPAVENSENLNLPATDLPSDPEATASESTVGDRSPASLGKKPKTSSAKNSPIKTTRTPAKAPAVPKTQPLKSVRKVASKATATAIVTKDIVKSGRYYEMDLNLIGDRLVLEESVIDGRPAYFMEQRRGKKKVVGVLALAKEDFERWSAELDQPLKKTGQVTCDRARRIYRRQAGRVKTLRLCENQLSPAQTKSLAKLSLELTTLLKKPVATKAARN